MGYCLLSKLKLYRGLASWFDNLRDGSCIDAFLLGIARIVRGLRVFTAVMYSQRLCIHSGYVFTAVMYSQRLCLF
jgi:hypothetical protein